jgi:hypothetical protein
MTQKDFCSIVTGLRHRQTSLERSAGAARATFDRLAGHLAFAQRSVLRDANALLHPLDRLSVPVDTNLLTELLAHCPGIFPPLPKNAAQAILVASALQSALKGPDPTRALNQMLGNPAGRLANIRKTVQGVADQFTGLLKLGKISSAKIPGVGDLAKTATGLLKEQAGALATRAAVDALTKAGFNVAAAERCAKNLCAVGARFNPPG